MLRGASTKRATLELEHTTGANGDAQQTRSADELASIEAATAPSERVLVDQSVTIAVGVLTVNEDKAADAVLSIKATNGLDDELEFAGGVGASDPARLLASDQVSVGGDGDAVLPPDPLDPMWARPSTIRDLRDRTLTESTSTQVLAVGFDGLPARLLESASVQESTFDLLQIQEIRQRSEDVPMWIVVMGGLLLFAVAGVAVNRMRRLDKREPSSFSKTNKKLKTFDEVESDDEDGNEARDSSSGDRVYAQFS